MNEPLLVDIRIAAQMVGVSSNHFREHILREVKTVTIGRRRLIEVASLKKWVANNSAR